MITANGASEGFRPCRQKKECVFKRMRFRFHQKRIDSRPHKRFDAFSTFNSTTFDSGRTARCDVS